MKTQKNATAATAAQKLNSNKSIPPNERYTKLRKKFKEYDYRPFNQSIEEIISKSRGYVTKITTGRGNLNPEEMELLLEAIDEPVTPENLIKYFPPMGLEPSATAIEEVVRTTILKLLGGIT